MLAALYGAVARSGLADQLGAAAAQTVGDRASPSPPHLASPGVVAEGRAGAAAHRAAQRAAKTRVPIFGLLRDVGARRDSAGRPHADLSALDADAALYDGCVCALAHRARPHRPTEPGHSAEKAAAS